MRCARARAPAICARLPPCFARALPQRSPNTASLLPLAPPQYKGGEAHPCVSARRRARAETAASESGGWVCALCAPAPLSLRAHNRRECEDTQAQHRRALRPRVVCRCDNLHLSGVCAASRAVCWLAAPRRRAAPCRRRSHHPITTLRAARPHPTPLEHRTRRRARASSATSRRA